MDFDLSSLTRLLVSSHLLSATEVDTILSQGDDNVTFDKLCRALAAKGSATLMDIMTAIRSLPKQSRTRERVWPGSDGQAEHRSCANGTRSVVPTRTDEVILKTCFEAINRTDVS